MRRTESVDLEATIKVDLAKRAASAPAPKYEPKPSLRSASVEQPATGERRVSPQRAEFGRRMAILMEEEALARAAEQRRTRRWLIGATAVLVGIVLVPLVFSAMTGKKSAPSAKPAAVRTAPVK